MGTLSELYLDGTAIHCLHESLFQFLKGLSLLNLSGSKNFCGIFSICSLSSLKSLYISSCSSKYCELPEDIGRLEHLEELDLCESAIRVIPRSITSLKNLKLLCLHGCSKLHVPYYLSDLTSLRTLNLGGCNIAEGYHILDRIGNLSSLQSLDLSENNFSSIPESISQLSELREIALRDCANLRSLPGDPPASVKNVDIRGCTSLTDCSDSWTRMASDAGLRIRNCSKWDDRRPLMSLSVQFDEFHETPYPQLI